MAYQAVDVTYIEALIPPSGGGASTRQRIGEVRTWGDSSSTSSQDIPIIGRVDAEGNAISRTRNTTGSEQVTLECYFDLADYPQSHLQKGQSVEKIYVCAVGEDNDLIVYSDCEVGSRNRSGSEYNGLVGVSLSITVNGGSLENQPKA